MIKQALLIVAAAGLLLAQFQIPKVPKLPGGGSSSASGGSANSPLGGGGRVKAELDQAERALDGCDRTLKNNNPDGCTSYHTKFDDSIADAQKAIQGSTLGGVAQYVTRINELKARRDQQLTAMKGSAEANAAPGAIYTGEDAGKDKLAIEALKTFYKDFHGMHSTSAPTEDAIALAGQWSRVRTDVQRLLTKYPPVKSRQNIDPAAHEMIAAVRFLEGDHKQCLLRIDKGVTEMPRLLKFDLDQAIARLDRAESVDGKPGDGVLASGFLEGADRRLKHYTLMAKDHPKYDPQLEPATRAELKTANERLEKFFEKVIAENQMPADNYAGPDAASLKEAARQAWTKNFPKFKILKIGLTGEWNRTKGWKWEDNRSAWFKFDGSRLNGYLIVDTGHPKYVYIRSMSNTKDHLNGDRVQTGVGIWDPADKPHPAGTYLRANVK
jgi:hypothetical protein